jgi:hypothetical protein
VSELRPMPKTGDVVASRPTARADVYAISIVPAAAHATATRYSEAIEETRELARGRRVDGWFTCNHTHYTRVATHRSSTDSNATDVSATAVAIVHKEILPTEANNVSPRGFGSSL